MDEANASAAHTHTMAVRAPLPSGCDRAIQLTAVAAERESESMLIWRRRRHGSDTR
jgi:hypothetical protein